MTADSKTEIRKEREGEFAATRDIHLAAFETPAEADLVDALRRRAQPIVSLVAARGGTLVGHILFSPVSLTGHPEIRLMGLAPMAVAPDYQRQGIGSQLVRAGLEGCRRIEAAAIVVLGHADYYPRFGFRKASSFGIRSEYEVPDEVFMAMELEADALANATGTVHYHAAFGEL